MDDELEHDDQGDFADHVTDSESEDESVVDNKDDFDISDVSEEFDDVEKDALMSGLSEDEIIHNIGLTLKRVRNLVKMTRNSSNILSYMRIKQNDAQINYQLLKDFKIRWNYTYLFLERVLKYRPIINELTKNPSVVIGIQNAQINRLKRLVFSDKEWKIIIALIEVLGPFYHATKMLSGRNYQTQSISYVVINALKSYLNTLSSYDNDDNIDSDSRYDESIEFRTDDFYELSNNLKNILLKSLNFYLKKHLSDNQYEAILVLYLYYLVNTLTP